MDLVVVCVASTEHAVRNCPFSDIERTLEAVMTACALRAGGVGGWARAAYRDGSVPEV